MSDNGKLFEQFEAWVESRKKQDKPNVEQTEEYRLQVEKYEALQAEHARLLEEKEKREAEVALQAAVERYSADIGESYAETDVAAILARMENQEDAKKLAEQFKAKAEQANPELFGELGSTGDGLDEADRFVVMAEGLVNDGKAKNMTEAYAIVNAQNPELYRAYRNGRN